MRGHVRRRGDTWTIYYDRPRDASGRRRKTSKGGFRTRKDAERWLTQTLGKIERGAFVEASRQSLATYLDAWLAGAKVDLRASTLPFYEIAISLYIVPRIGGVPLQRLTPQTLNALYTELLESGRCQRPGGLSPTTVRRVHSILRRALQDAVDTRLLEVNPADRARPPKLRTTIDAARRQRRFWTAEEVRAFLDALDGDRLQAAFHLAATTGMRRGEVLGVRWRDVDLELARVRVEQTLVAPRYVLTFSSPKTSFARRTIDLDEETVSLLRTHRSRQAQEQLAFGFGYAETELLFRNEDGTPVMPQLFSLRFKSVVKRAGLTPIRLHDLRHTHVALLAGAGVPAKVIQERVGHHSAGFTLDNYGGTFPAQHRAAAERFAELVSPGLSAVRR